MKVMVEKNGKSKRQVGNGNNESSLGRREKKENTRGEKENAESTGMVEGTQSQGLSNYQKQQQEKLGKDFKA